MTELPFLFGILAIFGLVVLFALLAGDLRSRKLRERHLWQARRVEVAREILHEIQIQFDEIPVEPEEPKAADESEVGPAGQKAATTQRQPAEDSPDVEAQVKLAKAISDRAQGDPQSFSSAIRALISLDGGHGAALKQALAESPDEADSPSEPQPVAVAEPELAGAGT